MSKSTNTSLNNVIAMLFKHELFTVVDYSVIDYSPTLLVRGMTALPQRVLGPSYKSPALCDGSLTSRRLYFITCLQSRVGSANWEAPFQISPKGLRKFLASWQSDTNVSLTLCSRYYGMCEKDDCARSPWPVVVSTISLPLIWAGCRHPERGVCHKGCWPRDVSCLIRRGVDGGALKHDGKESLLLIVGV